MSVKDLRRSPMMCHLLDALEEGKDIGEYGRLTVAMVAHHFVEPDELVKLLTNPGGPGRLQRLPRARPAG